MATSEIKGQKLQTHQDVLVCPEKNLIDFDKFHSALRTEFIGLPGYCDSSFGFDG